MSQRLNRERKVRLATGFGIKFSSLSNKLVGYEVRVFPVD